jgi:hypothetical protein
LVIKSKYHIGEPDVLNPTAVIDSMPIKVLRDYVISQGGEWDENDAGDVRNTTCPHFYAMWGNDGPNTDLPFCVTSEDNYHFVLPVSIQTGEGATDKKRQIIEATKQNGE